MYIHVYTYIRSTILFARKLREFPPPREEKDAGTHSSRSPGREKSKNGHIELQSFPHGGFRTVLGSPGEDGRQSVRLASFSYGETGLCQLPESPRDQPNWKSSSTLSRSLPTVLILILVSPVGVAFLRFRSLRLVQVPRL